MGLEEIPKKRLSIRTKNEKYRSPYLVARRQSAYWVLLPFAPKCLGGGDPNNDILFVSLV